MSRDSHSRKRANSAKSLIFNLFRSWHGSCEDRDGVYALLGRFIPSNPQTSGGPNRPPFLFAALKALQARCDGFAGDTMSKRGPVAVMFEMRRGETGGPE